MAFPSSPTNNQVAIINGVRYVYATATNSWSRQTAVITEFSANSVSALGNSPSTSTTTGALLSSGGAGIAGNLYVGGTANIAGVNIVANLATTTTAIVTANTAMKGYVDSQTSAVTSAWQANATTQQGQIATLQSQVYSNSNVNAYLTSTGAGNITISSGAFSLTPSGPGAVNVGSSVSIPTIVTDAYGRIVSLTSNSVSTTFNLAGTTGTGAVTGGGTLTFSSTNGVVVAASGSTVSISSPQDLRTTASPTFDGITTNGLVQVNGTLGVQGVTTITNSTTSTGAGNGALVITGGAGVGGISYFGNDVHILGNLYVPNVVATSTSTLSVTSPLVYLTGDPYPYDFEIGLYGHFIGGSANVYGHSGMVRNHNNNRWVFFSNVASEPTSTTINFADTGIVYDTVEAGALVLANSTISTSTTTGALVVNGGAGIGGNLNVNSAGYFGYNAAGVNLVNPTLISTASSQSVNAGAYYVQTAVINSEATGSSDMIAYPNNGNSDTGWVDVGITGNLFSDPLYTVTKSNDGYVFMSAAAGTGLGGNLVLATDRTGTYNDIVVAVGSFFSNAEVARFHGNTSNGGYLQLTQGTAATSTSTGALRVTGGVGVSGALYAGSLYDNGSRPITSLNLTAGTAIGLSTTTLTGPSSSLTITNTGVTGLSSSGTGNLTVSAATGAITVSLPATGPGATTIGDATAIPVITTDAYGRIVALSTASVSSTLNIAGTSGTGSVGLASQSLTVTGGTGISTSALNQTITVTNTGVTGLSSSGTGNLTVSTSTGAVTVSLPATGPGATTVGSPSVIPVITTDEHGRIVALTSSPVSTTINLSNGAPSSGPSIRNSYLFNNSKITVPSAAMSTIGTNDFTLEMWLNPGSLGVYQRIISLGGYSQPGNFEVELTNGILVHINGAFTDYGGAISTNTWYHLAVSRNSGSVRVFLNGSQIGTTTTQSGAISNSAVLSIGTDNLGDYFNGYISDLRIVHGTGLYTSNFAVPSNYLTAVSGTQLLTLQSSTLVDNSSNNYTITVVQNAPTAGMSTFPSGSAPTTGNVAGGGTLTIGGVNGVTTAVSGSNVTIGTSQNLRSNASPTFAGATVNGTIVATALSAATIGNISANHVGTGTYLTSLNASNITTGTLPPAVLSGSLYVGTTAIALNRTSASQTLTGVSIDGSAASASTATTATNVSGGSVSATTGAFSGTTTRNNKALITNYSGTTAPTNPQQGDEWYKTDTGVMYKYIYDGASYVWVNVSSALFNASTSATANTLALRDGSGNLTATNFNGVASSAKYADLAEVYVADLDYEPGTVVVFGGEQEITTTTFSHDTRVAGVISTNPAYLMNSETVGLPVALTGRVPCKVKGFVKKGDILVTSSVPGVAQKMSDDWYKPGCIIGKAIGENKTSGIATIEVVVGRF